MNFQNHYKSKSIDGKSDTIINFRTDRRSKLYRFLNQYNSSPKHTLISIILPVFNEENTIKSVLKSLPHNNLIEIIVVDDYSSDNSLKETESLKNLINLKIYAHNKNRGYGGAIITGMKHAKGEVIITMDSDGQHDPNDILTLVTPIFNNKADYTIGSRYLGRNLYDLPLRTRLGEALIEIFLHMVFSIRIRNNQNGFRAFKRSLITHFVNARFHGYVFATESIIKAALYGFKVMECPINVYHRIHGKSRIVLSRLTLDLFSCLLIYIFEKIRVVLLHSINKIR